MHTDQKLSRQHLCGDFIASQHVFIATGRNHSSPLCSLFIKAPRNRLGFDDFSRELKPNSFILSLLQVEGM